MVNDFISTAYFYNAALHDGFVHAISNIARDLRFNRNLVASVNVIFEEKILVPEEARKERQ